MGRRQPDVERVPTSPARAGPPTPGMTSLRYLRWFGILLPVVAITALHLVRPALVASEHPLVNLDLTLRALALALGLTAFYLVDRAYRLVLRRNRELAAVNAVAAAVRGSTDVDELATAALAAVTQATGAGRVELTWAAGGHRAFWEHGTPGPYEAVEVPLGDDDAGRLTLHGARLPLSPATLATIGEHIGGAVHRAHLVADLMAAERQAATVEERDRIAREMHDSLAQVLGVTHLRLLSVCARPGLPDDVAAELSELVGICHDAYIDVREGILGLREASRPERSLVESLDTYVAKFSRQSRIDTTLCTAAGEALDLGPQAEIQIIRVIQEALTNIRKHSGARAATVTIREEGDQVVFDVADDGCGFDPDRLTPERFGLHSMRERTELLGGELAVVTRPGRGTRVTAVVPRPGARTHSEVLK